MGEDKKPSAEELLIQKITKAHPSLDIDTVFFLHIIQNYFLSGVTQATVHELVDETYALISVRLKEKAH